MGFKMNFCRFIFKSNKKSSKVDEVTNNASQPLPVREPPKPSTVRVLKLSWKIAVFANFALSAYIFARVKERDDARRAANNLNNANNQNKYPPLIVNHHHNNNNNYFFHNYYNNNNSEIHEFVWVKRLTIPNNPIPFPPVQLPNKEN